MFRPVPVILATAATAALAALTAVGVLAQPDNATPTPAPTPACIATEAATAADVEAASVTRVTMPNGKTVTVTDADWAAGAVFPDGSRVTAYCR